MNKSDAVLETTGVLFHKLAARSTMTAMVYSDPGGCFHNTGGSFNNANGSFHNDGSRFYNDGY